MKWETILSSAGRVSGRQSYFLTTKVTLTYTFPKWFSKLQDNKIISPTALIRTWRSYNQALEEFIDVDENFLEGTIKATIIVPDFKGQELVREVKALLRLFNNAVKNFLAEFKDETTIEKLKDYRLIGKKVIYCPVGPRKKKLAV